MDMRTPAIHPSSSIFSKTASASSNCLMAFRGLPSDEQMSPSLTRRTPTPLSFGEKIVSNQGNKSLRSPDNSLYLFSFNKKSQRRSKWSPDVVRSGDIGERFAWHRPAERYPSRSMARTTPTPSSFREKITPNQFNRSVRTSDNSSCFFEANR